MPRTETVVKNDNELHQEAWFCFVTEHKQIAMNLFKLLNDHVDSTHAGEKVPVKLLLDIYKSQELQSVLFELGINSLTYVDILPLWQLLKQTIEKSKIYREVEPAKDDQLVLTSTTTT